MELKNRNIQRDTIQTLKRWLENKNEGKNIANYFLECGYKSVGICDGGEIGRILYEEIKNKDILVKWFADENAEGQTSIDGIPVNDLYEVTELADVDVICVSPVYNYEEVNKYIVINNPKMRTISLKDLVYEM